MQNAAKAAGCGALVAAALVLRAALGAAQESDATASEPQPETAAPREPITSISGSAPSETLQERMQRFKREKGAGSDKPFEGFATQAEAEMQRLRDEAIANPGGTDEQLDAEQAAAVESRIGARERLEDKLAALGAWGASGCVEIEPAWNTQDDFIRHRKLRVADFQSPRDKSAAAVAVSGIAATGFAALTISCELEPRVAQTGDGGYVAHLARARYYAVLSRKDSWLAEHPEHVEAFMIGHQQLHFDMAEAFAKWLTARRDDTLAQMRGAGRSPQLALGQLQLAWAKHMLDVHEDFDAIESAFDRATQHGRQTEKQTEWAFKIDDGFEAFSEGLRLRTRPKRR